MVAVRAHLAFLSNLQVVGMKGTLSNEQYLRTSDSLYGERNQMSVVGVRVVSASQSSTDEHKTLRRQTSGCHSAHSGAPNSLSLTCT